MKYTRKQVLVEKLESAAQAYQRCEQWVRKDPREAQQRIEEETRKLRAELARRSDVPF
jgi:hypothetical protein